MAEITVPDSGLVENFVSPRIRIFYNESNDHAYLFYMNRFCGEYYTGNTDLIPVDISIQGTQLPESPANQYLFEDALDHSRRCLVPVEAGARDWYFFDDTLAAGESRLLEFVDLNSAIQADLRVTSPDVFCYSEGLFNRRRELRCKAGTNLNLGATFYNMGTDSTGDVEVTFTDHSEASPSVIGTDTLNLSGLSGDYEPDSTSAVITWNTDAGDIGIHVIEISADSISGEDYFDNTIFVTVLVEPRDYATEVRRDTWDMDYDSTSNWHTGDIDAIDFNWDTTSTGWTDSVSGMFEGVLDYDTSTGWFKGAISLAIPDSVSKYINTGTYHMLSFGIVVNNPNTLSDNACNMKFAWRDALNNWNDYVGLLAGTGYHVGNGWDRWSVIGPIDLKADTSLHWGDGNAKELWIRFQYSITPQPEPLDTLPLDIRIGWVRLEESAQ
ncbi:hypothetical protein DRQ25_11220 [Candidatus Fermentibacteria bacterium]|nr:MAG: hypothetical protein DRQ25_11220 [Candidatus Fermentibacteria bacterium]